MKKTKPPNKTPLDIFSKIAVLEYTSTAFDGMLPDTLKCPIAAKIMDSMNKPYVLNFIMNPTLCRNYKNN